MDANVPIGQIRFGAWSTVEISIPFAPAAPGVTMPITARLDGGPVVDVLRYEPIASKRYWSEVDFGTYSNAGVVVVEFDDVFLE